MPRPPDRNPAPPGCIAETRRAPGCAGPDHRRQRSARADSARRMERSTQSRAAGRAHRAIPGLPGTGGHPAARPEAGLAAPGTAHRIAVPYPARGLGLSNELQRVKAQRVVPEDLLLAAVAQWQRQKAIRRLGVFRIPVWVVGGGDEIVVAECGDHVRDELLVALDRAEALAPKILGRLRRQMGHLAIG